MSIEGNDSQNLNVQYIILCFRSIVLGETPVKKIDKYIPSRPIWFIYTGMGCQWLTMGRDLLKIEVFRNTFDRCAEILKKYDVDLYHIVTTDDATIFDHNTNSLVGICAIQLALTDLLFSLNIHPDGIAGHSMGEIGNS